MKINYIEEESKIKYIDNNGIPSQKTDDNDPFAKNNIDNV